MAPPTGPPACFRVRTRPRAWRSAARREYNIGIVFSVPRVVKRFARPFADRGLQCWLVGGAVRDLLMRRPPGDFDIATDAHPEQVGGMFRHVIPTGLRHGTVTVLFAGRQLEVTTFRTESGYRDGRRPDSVAFAPTIEEDLSRRDFTINGIAMEVPGGRIVDPFGGRADLKRGLIRAIGDPAERFAEDGLRPLRACRIAAQLGFRVDAATGAAIPGSLDTVRRVAAERIGAEIDRIVLAPRPSVGLRLMEETGLLELLLPELHRCVGVEQRQPPGRAADEPEFDVFTHSLAACDASDSEPVLRWAGLLHDIGKATTMVRDADGTLTFHHHDRESARMTGEIFDRLRYPHARRDEVAHLVALHMFQYDEHWSDAAVRRFVARVGRDRLDDLLALRRADQMGRYGAAHHGRLTPRLVALASRVEAVMAQSEALTVRDLAVNGNDLMTELDLAPGPVLGVLLRELLEAVLDDPTQNQRDTLLAIAANFYRSRIRQDARPQPAAGPDPRSRPPGRPVSAE